MGKVYLLLRNNIESGPFSIDELLQQKIAASDLIWIEGESLNWQEPSQIMELGFGTMSLPEHKNVFCQSPAPVSQVIPYGQKTEVKIIPIFYNREAASFARSQGGKIENRASNIDNRALSVGHDQAIESSYGNSFSYQQEKKIDLVFYKKNRKNVVLPEIIAAGMVTAFIAIGIYGGWTMINTKDENNYTTALPLKISEPPITKTFESQTPENKGIILTTDSTAVQSQPVLGQTPPLKQNPKTQSRSTTAKKKNAVKKETIKPELTSIIADEVPVIAEPEPQEEEIITEPEQKKKSLGQAIKNIFKKKKKKQTETESATTVDSKDSLNN